MAKNIPVLLVTAPALKDVAKGSRAKMLNVSKISFKVVKCVLLLENKAWIHE